MSHASATFAFDKKSARSFDADGRMRVRGCVLSVAEINPYRGREIPGYQALGLDANRVYDLYRAPEELKRSTDSFDGLPLMIRHIAQTAKEPRKEYIGGSVYNTVFDDATGALMGDILVMDEKAIEYIQSGTLSDLSNGYRYKPDMTPGEINGRKYDGVMRAIEGNHVALVEDGRATGAHVADSALSSPTGDSNVDPNDNSGTPAAPSSETSTAEFITKAMAMLETLDQRLTKIEGGKVDTPQSEAEAGIPASVNKANDESSDDDDKKDDDDKSDNDDDNKKGEDQAMDSNTVKALIDAAVGEERKRAAGVEAAKRATRQDLGDTIALDSEADIYRAALKQRGVNLTDVAPGTEKLAYMAVKSASAPTRSTYAQDSNGDNKPTFNTSRIRYAGK